jgi:hypothetical protein
MFANDLPLLLPPIAFVAHEGVTFVKSSEAVSNEAPDARASRSAAIFVD